MMYSRLDPFMDTIISKSQSAFIKARSIQYNFLCVQNYVRRLHRTNTLTILLNIDIEKAFDSVRWDYLLDLMQRCEFPAWFQNWLVALFITSSSHVLLSGVPRDPIVHGRGLHQGDPLSPILFDISIDPLQ
jgi:hypothetical protein